MRLKRMMKGRYDAQYRVNNDTVPQQGLHQIVTKLTEVPQCRLSSLGNRIVDAVSRPPYEFALYFPQ